MESQINFIENQIPSGEEILFTLGKYQVIRSIGKGGMGEVFLAYDTEYGRKIALKKIRSDLTSHGKIQNRFLREARITSQLTHPVIIPIYAIHEEDEEVYYTMPFVEGETLKQILRDANKKEKKGEEVDHSGTIPSLLRIFVNVCQAIAYAHSHQILHRDIKPENVIVGPFGEVFILDWGLAKTFSKAEEEEDTALDEEESPKSSKHYEFTHVGKVVGTVSYMAPERAKGQAATAQTDIYALGVFLYQILTLKLPFNRGTIKEYRKVIDQEIIPDPLETSPHRDIPPSMTHVVHKCLAKDPSERYQTVNELIADIENYTEGRSGWFHAADLDIHQKQDWEFQENIFLADHIAITRGAEEADWVSLMISSASFIENTKLEATVTIGESGHGLGFLLSLPEAALRSHFNEGYCLWLGSDLNKTTKLMRSAVEVIHAPEIYLQRGRSYQIRIEKIDHNLYFYLNNTLQFSYVSYLPLVGTHIGLLSRDDDFTISPITISVGSQNININCLAVPDAFLAHKNYSAALIEYRRIGYSFPGHAEGREAMFRAGITLIEQAKASGGDETLFDQALDEFEKLHHTHGAPLEYLGKSLVYQGLHEYEEEIKCFELAYRRYPQHPLLRVLQEQIIYRMHEHSRSHRKATYQCILLAIQHLPKVVTSIHSKRLFRNVQKYWEHLPFILEDPLCATSKYLQNTHFGIQLAFWLCKPYTLAEFINGLLKKEKRSPLLISNALFCLVELGSWEFAKNKMETLLKRTRDYLLQKKCEGLQVLFNFHENGTIEPPTLPLEKDRERIYFYLIEQLLNRYQGKEALKLMATLRQDSLRDEVILRLDCYEIWAHLIEKDWKAAGEKLHCYPIEQLNKETSLLQFLYGCWLFATEGEEIANAHFSGTVTASYPRTWTICSQYLYGKPQNKQVWLDKFLMWEKRKLWQQLALFYHCIGDNEQKKWAQEQEQQEYLVATEE